jgi:argininosuccinate lyase
MTLLDNAIDHAQGVGGRLSVAKTALYQHAVGAVEARANQFTGRYMLVTDIAYVLTSVETGVTPAEDGRKLVRCLLDLLGEVEHLLHQPSEVDIVILREAWVIERVGKDIGGRLHVGRHRAESIRNLLPRLFFRQALYEERRALLDLISALHVKAKPVLTAYMPLYHHIQHSSITTLGEYLLSWASNLLPYLERLQQADARLDVAPPPQTSRPEIMKGATIVARRLGFSKVGELRQQQHVTEDQLIEPLFALVMVNVTMARFLIDMQIFGTDEFNFFQPSDAHASGSSGLPQKKNPFGFQTVIGGASVSIGRLMAQFGSAIAQSCVLDSVFNAGSLYQQARDIVGWTQFVAEAIELGEFNLKEMERKSSWGFGGMSEALDKLVYEEGVSLRVAHHELGFFVREVINGRPAPDLKKSLSEHLGRPVKLENAEMLAIIKGELIPSTTINREAVEAVWNRMDGTLKQLASVTPEQSSVEQMIKILVAEAEKFVAT